MKDLWAPWRMEYIEQIKPSGCILCLKPQERRDEENYILHRGELNFIILNTYPYNPGHLMVAPYRHEGQLEGLTRDEWLEHSEMVRAAVAALERALHPQGFNIGLNLGRVACAGIEDHIHTHVVPRWGGDTNFMPVIADTRVIPEMLEATFRKLKSAWNPPKL